MPGLVLFGRRWAIGSDDFVMPAAVCSGLHGIWCLAIFGTLLASIVAPPSVSDWVYHSLFGLNLTFAFCQLANSIADLLVAKVSAAGSILDDSDRRNLPILLYVRCGILALNLTATLAGIIWLIFNYTDGTVSASLRKCLLATVIWQLLSAVSILCMAWGCYDSAGRNWLMLKRFEDRSHNTRVYKRSGTRRRTWRRRKVMLAYQASWRRRLRMMAGCVGASEDDKAAMTEVARLFTEFFYELDVVPSDLLAGFALLRTKQKLAEPQMMEQAKEQDMKSDKILSGVIITPKTRFMDFRNQDEVDEIRTLRYYMQYALAAYGWPFYLTNNRYGRLCDLLLNISFLPRPTCLRVLTLNAPTILEDNCFHCHSTAIKLTLPRAHVDLVYACWHCHIGQTPFYVAVDHREKVVVICLRGTMSMNDFITDFNAQPENIPLTDPRPSSAYQAHRGIIVAALYVFQRLKSETILESAFSKAGPAYQLRIVGHSLGGGAATILAMLLRPTYPDLHCYVFAPPGGLLTKEAVELCRPYVTTLIVGKDLVARLALAQMETMRAELVQLLTVCTEPKWRIIGRTMGCCGISEKDSPDSLDGELLLRRRSNIALRTSSGAFPPMYPPGNVMHIVRSWEDERSRNKKPNYVALRADNAGFNEILISPVMVHDHMPDGIIEALDGLLEQLASSPCLPKSVMNQIEIVANDTKGTAAASSITLNFVDSNANEDIV